MPSTNMLVLRIELQDTDPLVWRQIAVPADYELTDLSEVLQMAMGWNNVHEHIFRIAGKEYSADQDLEDAFKDQLTVAVACKKAPKGFEYIYDFGDEWIHTITLVKKYKEEEVEDAPPLCLDGARSCPPEISAALPDMKTS